MAYYKVQLTAEMPQGSGHVLARIDTNFLAEFDAENYKDNAMINLDPAKFQLLQGV